MEILLNVKLLIPIPSNPELDWSGRDVLMQLAIEVPLEGELPVLFHQALNYLLCATLAQGHRAKGSYKIDLCLSGPWPLTQEGGHSDMLLITHELSLIAPWIHSWVKPTILASLRITGHYITPVRMQWLSDRWKVDIIATTSVISVDSRHDVCVSCTCVNLWLQATVFVVWNWLTVPRMHCG